MDDSFFIYILAEISEFKEYTTGLDDLEECSGTNFITPDIEKKSRFTVQKTEQQNM